jgi:hypothetical protein
MTQSELPAEFFDRLQAVKGKRARIVVDHILQHGFITTEELETVYGYQHPPRAIRDVREQGIPLETFQTKNAQGKSIAAYRFADLSGVSLTKSGGRKSLPKAIRRQLLERSEQRCAIGLEKYDDRYLQIDHRIPYEIAGEVDHNHAEAFMVLCRSCNRAKSWSCEHCANWLEAHNPELCRSCY